MTYSTIYANLTHYGLSLKHHFKCNNSARHQILEQNNVISFCIVFLALFMEYYRHITQCNVLKRLYRYVPSSTTFSPIIIRVAALCADNICMETLLIIFAWLLHDEWVVGKLPLMLRRPPHDHDRCQLKLSTKFRGIFHNFLGKNMCT